MLHTTRSWKFGPEQCGFMGFSTGAQHVFPSELQCVSVYRAWLVSTDMVQALSTDVTHSVYNKFIDYSPKKVTQNKQ